MHQIIMEHYGHGSKKNNNNNNDNTDTNDNNDTNDNKSKKTLSVDHIKNNNPQDKLNNRLDNLKLSTQTQQNENKQNANNGIKGDRPANAKK